MEDLKQVHGTNPLFLIEKIMRERIFDSLYWKEHMYGRNAETIIDLAENLVSIGGQYSNQKPTEFICIALKMLQIQPEPEIIQLYLETPDYKYLTAVACFYVRLTQSPLRVYQLLEPFLLDRRKLRYRNPGIDKPNQDGTFSLTFMDVFVDDLLQKERVCDTILPRLTQRYLLEDAGELDPFVSVMDDELFSMDAIEKSESSAAEEEPQLPPATTTTPIDNLPNLLTEKKKVWSKKKQKQLFKAEKPKKKDQTPNETKDSISIDESNKLRESLGLSRLK
jgi:pre-mRNA-splicing factor 38A